MEINLEQRVEIRNKKIAVVTLQDDFLDVISKTYHRHGLIQRKKGHSFIVVNKGECNYIKKKDGMRFFAGSNIRSGSTILSYGAVPFIHYPRQAKRRLFYCI